MVFGSTVFPASDSGGHRFRTWSSFGLKLSELCQTLPAIVETFGINLEIADSDRNAQACLMNSNRRSGKRKPNESQMKAKQKKNKRQMKSKNLPQRLQRLRSTQPDCESSIPKPVFRDQSCVMARRKFPPAGSFHFGRSIMCRLFKTVTTGLRVTVGNTHGATG